MTHIILLVEDNPDDQVLTMSALTFNQYDCKVVVASDGEEALDYLKNRGRWISKDRDEFPSIIILDLNMPRKDGLSLLKEINADEVLKVIPSIVLTTSKDEKDIRYAYAYGANSFIKKPVDFDKFTELLQQIVTYWLELNELPSPKMSS